MKILIIKPSSLGDVIHALPFLNAVKDSFPDSEIDWVISRSLKGILESNPLINELVVVNKDSWKRIRNLPKTVSELSSLNRALKSKKYDIVVDLQGLLRSGLIALSTPSTLKVGFADAREGSSLLYDKKVSVNGIAHAVDKCLEVAKAIGARTDNPRFPVYISDKAKTKVSELLGDIKEYIVIFPSSRWITKRWPAENFADLISKTPLPCVISGSRDDRQIARTIKDALDSKYAGLSQSSKTLDLCGKTDLSELVSLIAAAKTIVTNDSGPMHIAAALNKHTVALFGPTDPAKTGPYGWQKNKNLKVIRADVPCSPCRKKKNCSEFICMDQISVSQVLELLKGIT
jgi:heptosyltransferase-1